MTIERLHFAGGLEVSSDASEYAERLKTLDTDYAGEYTPLTVGYHPLATDVQGPQFYSHAVSVYPDGSGTLINRPVLDGALSLHMRSGTVRRGETRTEMGAGGQKKLVITVNAPDGTRRVHDILRFVPGPSPVAK